MLVACFHDMCISWINLLIDWVETVRSKFCLRNWTNSARLVLMIFGPVHGGAQFSFRWRTCWASFGGFDVIGILGLDTPNLELWHLEGFYSFRYLHSVSIDVITNKLADLWFDNCVGLAFLVCKSRRLVRLVILKAQFFLPLIFFFMCLTSNITKFLSKLAGLLLIGLNL